MTTYQELAEEMIGQMEAQLQSISLEGINKTNRVIFARKLHENLVVVGFEDEKSKRFIFNMDINLSEDIPLETVSYLAHKYANIIAKIHSIYSEDEFLSEWMMNQSFSSEMEW